MLQLRCPHCSTWVFFNSIKKYKPFGPYCCEYQLIPYAATKSTWRSSLQLNIKTAGCFLLILILLHDLLISLKLHLLLLPSVTEFFSQDPAVNIVLRFDLYLTTLLVGNLPIHPQLSHLGLAGTCNKMQVLAQSSGKTLLLKKSSNRWLSQGTGTLLATADKWAQWALKKPETVLSCCMKHIPGCTSSTDFHACLISNYPLVSQDHTFALEDLEGSPV